MKKPLDHVGRPFSQDTPAQQVGAVIMSLQGAHCNFQAGIISKEKMLEILDSHIKDFAILNKFLFTNQWSK